MNKVNVPVIPGERFLTGYGQVYNTPIEEGTRKTVNNNNTISTISDSCISK